jgi:hypothetical protein
MAIVLLLVLAGCATKPSLSPGAYTATISREDSSSYFFIGEWELTLTEGNGYSLSKDGRFDEEGDYTLTQDQIVFATTKSKEPPCPEAGTYQWAFDGKALILTTVEDTCPGRSTIFTVHPWSRQD